ncbi:hypothetical protein [Steroidobacter gossypii]|uniref:hypothetical protein n=1 Tax=Steroidobacter gossypii TaxID=2805490 RepID=UPI001C3F7DEF|nr:hypothetical protein [Steroidobacter gossypii]
MERGVVVGGLMICGSFLLAAMLNRSAMEEVPAPAATPSAVVPPVVAPAAAATPVDCTDAAGSTHPDVPPEPTPATDSDLMVNGTERCPR